MRLPGWEREKKLIQEGNSAVGLDEAGRGPLAGPVVAAACWIEPEFFSFLENNQGGENLKQKIRLVRDSKTLSPRQREAAFVWLNRENKIHFGWGQCSAQEIDRLNILGATLLAMRWATEELLEKVKNNSDWKGQPCLLVDGNRKVKSLKLPQEAIVGGDREVFSIAAASIFAKFFRDKLMEKFDRQYPKYGFARHRGYGTQKHYENLKKFGPCPLHRRSFRLE